jgi:permuted papain-like amidase YaeF/Yiix C92 family enzyme
MNLQPGDLILYRTTKNSPIHDKLISIGEGLLRRKFTPSNYCHVSMASNDTNLILEAVWPKTHVTKFDWNQPNELEIYRVKNATSEQIQTAINWAENHLDEWYDIPELFGGWISFKHEQICSTYISKSWKNAKIYFKTGKNGFITPEGIATDPLVWRVG